MKNRFWFGKTGRVCVSYKFVLALELRVFQDPQSRLTSVSGSGRFGFDDGRRRLPLGLRWTSQPGTGSAAFGFDDGRRRRPLHFGDQYNQIHTGSFAQAKIPTPLFSITYEVS
ncbi:uncharacterized protein LOC130764237 [Actinidia eriantha]|uniref:uncharacterized protein LOC130764237 n=1 Tax=Actinidia eriantha TaxID=165200 RepID=UPI00258CA7D3|nr:uncharacterized protein LOC130764237 [Actinidia eriantha]